MFKMKKELEYVIKAGKLKDLIVLIEQQAKKDLWNELFVGDILNLDEFERLKKKYGVK